MDRRSPPARMLTVAPYRYGGTVVGVLLNHRGDLAALGEAAHRPPYGKPPEAVVLGIKPGTSLIAPGGPALVDEGTPELMVSAALGIVIGSVACAVPVARALEHVAGYLAVADFSAPHDAFFRPQTRFKARDASCALGIAVERGLVADPDTLALRLLIDGELVHATSTAEHRRGVARLVADISDFMTLYPGDVVFTGPAAGAVRARAGATVAVEVDGLERVDVRVEREAGRP